MATKKAPRALFQCWAHSHEEDTASECVYRPASFAFPPSRGRSSFEIKPDGTMAGDAPGPVDRPVPTVGRRSYRGEESALEVYARDSSEPTKVMHVVSVSKQKLVLRQQ